MNEAVEKQPCRDRYVSIYFIMMLNLLHSHPGAETMFHNKGFSVLRAPVPATKNAVDPTIEQTINWHEQSGGGIVGYSRNLPA